MKKIILLICFVFIAVNPAFAHPPTRMKAYFNPSKKTITATIFHPTKDVQWHYINKVEIKLNGAPFDSVSFDKQATRREQILDYEFPESKKDMVIKPSDKFEITAFCNKAGKRSVEVK